MNTDRYEPGQHAQLARYSVGAGLSNYSIELTRLPKAIGHDGYVYQLLWEFNDRLKDREYPDYTAAQREMHARVRRLCAEGYRVTDASDSVYRHLREHTNRTLARRPRSRTHLAQVAITVPKTTLQFVPAGERVFVIANQGVAPYTLDAARKQTTLTGEMAEWFASLPPKNGSMREIFEGVRTEAAITLIDVVHHNRTSYLNWDASDRMQVLQSMGRFHPSDCVRIAPSAYGRQDRERILEYGRTHDGLVAASAPYQCLKRGQRACDQWLEFGCQQKATAKVVPTAGGSRLDLQMQTRAARWLTVATVDQCPFEVSAHDVVLVEYAGVHEMTGLLLAPRITQRVSGSGALDQCRLDQLV